jgi:hypothetical protein
MTVAETMIPALNVLSDSSARL